MKPYCLLILNCYRNMTLTIYAHPICAPCRMVVMTLEICGKQYEYKKVDILNGEQKSKEYLQVIIYNLWWNILLICCIKKFQINPAGVVPTLFDDDFCIMESRYNNLFKVWILQPNIVACLMLGYRSGGEEHNGVGRIS